ncbi:phospholipase D family protein [Pseudidiomarina sp.]|uniref:phospholipase D family protein n=1 Tax=Pseudidiomarina sp. TaxID=2081707 RepID=UPI00299F2702|nr:phospholipase D family protein [Pseudidiomarina sp.]MDX1705721.1 phospholipase D family protein [Pseudidiomarina sp.]
MSNRSDNGQIAESIGPLLAQHPDETGVLPLTDSQEAFAARIQLAGQAEFTLDLQYYIWRNDRTGALMFEAIHKAADRGVKVRLLLDDINTAGLDAVLTGLQAHPNIEIRLFNPLRMRWPRFINYLYDLRRINRRMHNKAFIVDGQMLISGGRNISDEYFGANDDLLFADLDALMIGDVVGRVSQMFDNFWNCDSAVPLGELMTIAKPKPLSALSERASVVESDPGAQEYVEAIEKLSFFQKVKEHELDFVWARVDMVCDPPSKGLGKAKPHQLIGHQLQQAIGEPSSHINLVSPYFVPTRAGVDQLVKFARQGITIAILTNSLAATDVAVVHAGYAKWRKRLLRAGIQLFELQRLSPLARRQERKERRKRMKGKKGRFGSSASSLHAKTFEVDHERVFFGSFNFDPRSVQLNTELGFVIHSDKLARMIAREFSKTVPHYAYKVDLIDNKIVWEERLGREVTRYRHEPVASWWRRVATRILERLPIDWLL